MSFQKNGKKDGTTTLWHRNEKAEEIRYENGKLAGRLIRWCGNGKVKMTNTILEELK